MENTLQCLKALACSDDTAESAVTIGETPYSLMAATDDEIKAGERALAAWRVVREYEVMVSGDRNASGSYIAWREEPQSVSFDELIFSSGECIGIYHEGCSLLFDDISTHRREKFIGEFITGPDRSRYVYDYYVLKRA